MFPLPEPDVTVVVIEMEPGRIYVKFVGPLPAPDRAEPLLRRAIDSWFGLRPQYALDSTEAVTEHGAVRGIHVRYRLAERPILPVGTATPRRPASPAIEVHDDILKRHPKEYIEAVIDEALSSWRESRSTFATTLMFNPRRIVVVLDALANRGAVLPLPHVEPAMNASLKAELAAWLNPPRAGFLRIHLADSWFLPPAIEKPNRTIYEPAFVATNMTYDRPENP